MTEWRDIPGWGGRYQVSDNGQIRSLQPGRRMKMRKLDVKPSGHHGVLLINPRLNMCVHRAVALAFIGPPPSDLHEVTHWDGDPANNRVANLRWATHAANMADKRRLNEHPKLTQSDVNDIKALRGLISTRMLARQYNVVPSHIWRIQNGGAWA